MWALFAFRFWQNFQNIIVKIQGNFMYFCKNLNINFVTRGPWWPWIAHLSMLLLWKTEASTAHIRFSIFWHIDLLFDPTWPRYKRNPEFIKTNILTNFHKDQMKIWFSTCTHLNSIKAVDPVLVHSLTSLE